MNRLLWLLQLALGIYFLVVGILHFVVPDGLPDQIRWMYELSERQHLLSGTAEILGGLGLILPGVTRIRPALTVWAALGLILVMIGALVWHAGRGEVVNLLQNVLLAGLLAVVVYGRWRLHPLPERRLLPSA